MIGEAKLKAQLTAIANIDTSEARREAMKVVFEESQRLVPVDKGDLKESAELRDEGDETTLVYGTDHAVHVEFGTVKMEAQPYIRPAFENMRGEMARKAADELQQEIRKAV